MRTGTVAKIHIARIFVGGRGGTLARRHAPGYLTTAAHRSFAVLAHQRDVCALAAERNLASVAEAYFAVVVACHAVQACTACTVGGARAQKDVIGAVVAQHTQAAAANRPAAACHDVAAVRQWRVRGPAAAGDRNGLGRRTMQGRPSGRASLERVDSEGGRECHAARAPCSRRPGGADDPSARGVKAFSQPPKLCRRPSLLPASRGTEQVSQRVVAVIAVTATANKRSLPSSSSATIMVLLAVFQSWCQFQ